MNICWAGPNLEKGGNHTHIYQSCVKACIKGNEVGLSSLIVFPLWLPN
jgi:hypothetical protein